VYIAVVYADGSHAINNKIKNKKNSRDIVRFVPKHVWILFDPRDPSRFFMTNIRCEGSAYAERMLHT